MANTGRSGFKSKLEYSTDGGTTYTKIGQCGNISGPNFSGKDININSQDNTDAFDEFTPGLVDPGEISCDLVWDKDVNATLYGMIMVKQHYRITFSELSTWVAIASLKGLSNDAPVDDKLSAKATFKISGKPTFTPAGS